jgi:hypothetical protein
LFLETLVDNRNERKIEDDRIVHATYDYIDGRIFQGEFVDGKMTVQAEFIQPNSDRYQRQIIDDLRAGNGTLFFANGHKYIGQFSKNFSPMVLLVNKTKIFPNHFLIDCFLLLKILKVNEQHQQSIKQPML